MSNIVIVYGSPCSGKSTYVKNNMKSNDIKFDYDFLLKSITALELHEYSKIHLPYVMDFRKAIVERSKSDDDIETTYIITTKITDELLDIVSEATVSFCEMPTSKEQCLNFLNDDDTRKDKDFWIDKINDWYSWRETFDLSIIYSKRQKRGDIASMIRSETQKRTATTVFNITRSEDSCNANVIEGYFVLFNEKTQLWDNCYEMIMPSSFDETLGNDIRALWNHNTQYVLGRNTNGTLEIRVDGKGVWGRITMPNTTYAKDLYELVKRGDVNQCSFGFNIIDEEWEQMADGSELFKVHKVDLHEISVVTFPAYEGTSVMARESQRRVELERKKREIKSRIEKRLEVKK